MIIRIGIIGLMLFHAVGLAAQSTDDINRAALMAELEKRNLSYEQVEERLALEGIDIDSLDINTMSPEEQQRIENILVELSRENQELAQPRKEEKADSEIETSVPVQDASKTVRDSSKEKLPAAEVYGQELFRNRILNIITNSNQLKAPESYVLGQGDQLVISVWGRSQIESSHTIQADGFIRVVDGRVRVYLKGLTLAQAREKIRRIYANEYSFRQGEFDVSVNYARTVRIGIYGEVLNSPGSFTISGFNSALNALSLVGGPNNIGSLRNIKLQKSNGNTVEIDVYAFMKRPELQSEYYLEDNDIILIPVSDKLIRISGAVRRPLKYELKSSEGLRALLDFAGGFADNAFVKKIQVKRFENNAERIIDIDWSELGEDEDFMLLNGDEIFVEHIEKAYRNYVSISGELQKPGQYERTEGMRILDLVERAGLTPNSSLELIYLIRTQPDGSKELIQLNLEQIMSDPAVETNMLLQDTDKLEVWSQERFADELTVAVGGAVRYNGRFPYDRNGNLRVSDAILLAGGLRRDASNYATIHYNDPFTKKTTYYKTIENLEEIVADPDLESNFLLGPFDSLEVHSLNKLEESLFVRIEGAVNEPGTYQYGKGMTLKDLLVMSGGFRQSASTSNVEVSRVVVENGAPTRVVVANLEMNRDYEVLSKGVSNGEYVLDPYDNIAVRYIRDYDLQDRVFVTGEVQIPGPYAIFEDNMRIASVIERAGGLTPEAFPEGATLMRSDMDYGPIVIKLDEIMNNPSSEFNFLLRDGDRISIPKINEFVAIKGATKVKEVALESSIADYNLIRVPYHAGKDALFYIEQFAGGFDDKADRSKVFVEYANGEIKNTKPGFFRKRYPEVRKGSVITVGYKDEKKEEKEGEGTDWSKILTDSVGQALSILTLILLVQRID